MSTVYVYRVYYSAYNRCYDNRGVRAVTMKLTCGALLTVLCWHCGCSSTTLGRQVQQLLGRDNDYRARVLRLTRSVNRIVDEYLGTRSVVMFADEVRGSELGERLLSGMAHPRVLVSRDDLRPATGLMVYLHRGRDDGYDAVLSRLPSSDHSRHMVLWGGVHGGTANDRVDLHRIQVTFETFWQYQLVDVAVLVPMSTGSIRVYSFNPYTASRCNKAGPPIMINVWSGWTNAFVRPDRIFGMDNKLKDLHKYIRQYNMIYVFV